MKIDSLQFNIQFNTKFIEFVLSELSPLLNRSPYHCELGSCVFCGSREAQYLPHNAPHDKKHKVTYPHKDTCKYKAAKELQLDLVRMRDSKTKESGGDNEK